MTLSLPVAVWQDAEGSFTATVLDGAEATAIDASAREAIAQLKKYLAWAARHGVTVSAGDLGDAVLRDHRVRIRPEYRSDSSVYPVSTPLDLRITCVHGRRQDGSGQCVIPTLGLRLSYQPDDPVDELVAEMVQQALGRKTPQELSRELMPPRLVLDAVHVNQRRTTPGEVDARLPALSAVAEELGRRTRGQRLARAIGREAEVKRLVERLTRETSSVLLVGESGAGKTTILGEAIRQAVRRPPAAAITDAERLANLVRRDPPRLRFWRTSGQRLIAGMKYLGQWEERCEQVVEELAESGGVLCIEDLLELVRVGGGEAGSSVAAFLMPYLERGELRLVAEATPSQLDACRRLLPGLAELFEVVRVPAFSPHQARAVLAELLDERRRSRRLTLDDGLADLIYRLFKRFQPYAAFPGKSAAFVRHLLDDAGHSGQRQITSSDVLERFRRETGLPEVLLRDDLPLPHEQVLADFRAAVLGQEAGCQAAAGVVTALKTGLNDPQRPLGVLLFCGPTGVGKTELAKVLARYLFGAGAERDRLVRLDMSEYAGPGAAQRLLMSPDGEVSELLRRVRRQPFVVVLLDEIEKASPEVHDVLLSMLDEGRLTDRFGRTTTFHSAAIVMTSNLGAERTAAVGYAGRAEPAFERLAMEAFRPEFFNRIDAVVTFQPLSAPTIAALARRELEAIGRRDGLVNARLRLTWTTAVVEHLAAQGYDPRYGARPLLRAAEQLIVAPLSRWLLANPALRDSKVEIDLGPDGALVFR